jgi:ubiquinone biosynthesis protein Coq4
VSERFRDPECELTLREGLDEYRAHRPALMATDAMHAYGAELLRAHDAAHVVFGCDTDLRGEVLLDAWTVAATDLGLRDYVGSLADPTLRQLVLDAGVRRSLLAGARSLPDVARVYARAFRMRRRWAWREWERALDVRLDVIRGGLGLRIVI